MTRSAFLRAAMFSVVAICRSLPSLAAPVARPGEALSSDQSAALSASITTMRSAGLIAEANLAASLLSQGIWRSASPNDIFIAQAERGGDTPFAYTLSPGHSPTAIVLAKRFFTDTTPTGRAAVMIHEMAHYRAYVKFGRSDEYDGYKAEYDSHGKLGLNERDGLVYFAMLDGTAEYVVPKQPSYRHNADLQQFLTN